MAMLPDTGHMDLVDKRAKDIFEKKDVTDAFSIAEFLMADPDLPMHCPYHHELVGAALWTAACIRENKDETFFEKGLATIRERASIIPGAFCGQYGTCGAGISTGIFAAVWMKTTPTSKETWGDVNSVAAGAFTEIASTCGPRCCKRVTYLALKGALPLIKERLGLDLGEFPEHSCSWYEKNKQCIETQCPFFEG